MGATVMYGVHDVRVETVPDARIPNAQPAFYGNITSVRNIGAARPVAARPDRQPSIP